MNKCTDEWTAVDETWAGKLLSRFLENVLWKPKEQQVVTETGTSAASFVQSRDLPPVFVIV